MWMARPSMRDAPACGSRIAYSGSKTMSTLIERVVPTLDAERPTDPVSLSATDLTSMRPAPCGKV